MKATTLLTVMVIAIGGGFAYDKYKGHWAPIEPQGAETAMRVAPATAVPATPAAPAYQCDGRTRCPQMRSCEEATYFIQHCPNTQMDGDRDGIPCERQWCN